MIMHDSVNLTMTHKQREKEMETDQAQTLLDEKIAISYEAPFADLLEWGKAIFYAVGLPSKTLRVDTIIRLRSRHRQAIQNAIDAGIVIPPDVMREYRDGLKAYR